MAATKKAISKAKYDEIKKYLHVPADDAGVMKKFSISQTTTRDIRNTKDYAEYCERRFRYHGYPKRSANLGSKMPVMSSHISAPDKVKTPIVIPVPVPVEDEKDDMSVLAKIVTVFLILCLCVAIATLTYKLLCWGFGL